MGETVNNEEGRAMFQEWRMGSRGRGEGRWEGGGVPSLKDKYVGPFSAVDLARMKLDAGRSGRRCGRWSITLAIRKYGVRAPVRFH